jgi:TonB family protein
VAPLLQQQLEGKYEILEKIKEGGMGAVYKVRHRFLDEIRVIKVIRSSLEQSQELSDRFLREARMAIRLRHPSIAVLHDFAVADGGQAFIVMEYIAGLTLEEALGTGGPPPLGLTLEVACQALRAMGYLHRHGFVHRDIAPDNLMLTRGVDGEPLVKLIDLGIAKVLAGEGAATTTGIFLGKPRYASPEHFGTKEMDHRSDLYSFGVVLYELLTGQCPVAGHDPASYMAGHLFRPPLDFAETDPHGALPAELYPIVLCALAKTPAERFASAADFARAIAPLQERFPVRAGDLDAVLQPVPGKTASWSAPAPVGSSQVLLDRQFLAGTTPPPAAHGGSHLSWDPHLVAPETLPPASAPQPAPRPAATVPAASVARKQAPAPDAALDETLPLTARQSMPAPPAPPSPRTGTPLAAQTLAGASPATPRPRTGAPFAAQTPGAEDWEARPLHRTLGFKQPAAAPPSFAALEARSQAAGTGRRATWAWVTGALLLVTGALVAGAWWYRHPRVAAGSIGALRSGDEPKMAAVAARPADAAGSPGVAVPPAAAGKQGAAPKPGLAGAPGAAAAAGATAPTGSGPVIPAAIPPPASGAQAPRPASPAGQPAAVGKAAPVEVQTQRASAGSKKTPKAPAPATDPGSAAAAIPAPDRLGPGDEAAEPVDVPDAVYPAAARGTGKNPSVLLAVLVDEHGNVTDVRVKEGDSSHLGFNEAAVAAARKARFLAATRNGAPVRSWSELMIEFVSPPNH